MTAFVLTFRGHTLKPPCIPSAATYVPHMAAAATTPLPELSADDAALFLRFIGSGTLDSLAASLDKTPLPHTTGWTLVDLYRWSTSESIAPWLAYHKSQVFDSRKTSALNHLTDLADNTQDPIERRRAATTILRALGVGALRPLRLTAPKSTADHARNVAAPSKDDALPSLTPPTAPNDDPATTTKLPGPAAYDWSRYKPPRAPLSLDSTPDLDAARLAFFAGGDAGRTIKTPDISPRPHPAATPTRVIDFVLSSLGRDSSLRGEDRFITAFNHSGIEDRSPESFEAFRKNLHASFPHILNSFHPLFYDERQTGDHEFTCLVSLMYPNRNCDRFRVRCRLKRPETGPLARCWLLSMAPEERPATKPDTS